MEIPQEELQTRRGDISAERRAAAKHEVSQEELQTRRGYISAERRAAAKQTLAAAWTAGVELARIQIEHNRAVEVASAKASGDPPYWVTASSRGLWDLTDSTMLLNPLTVWAERLEEACYAATWAVLPRMMGGFVGVELECPSWNQHYAAKIDGLAKALPNLHGVLLQNTLAVEIGLGRVSVDSAATRAVYEAHLSVTPVQVAQALIAHRTLQRIYAAEDAA